MMRTLPASDSKTRGAVRTLAEPVSRNLPETGSSSTVCLIA